MRNAYLMLLLSVFLFATCSKEDDSPPDPCEGIVCENGGSCVNGVCDCLEGWEGADCTEVATPSAITINSITVTRFPPTRDNGGSWDFTDGPDLIVRLAQLSNVLYESDYFFEDAVFGEEYLYTTNIRITDVQAEYVITLLDSDTFGDDEFMGGYTFRLFNSQYTSLPPSKFSIGVEGSPTAFELDVSYEY
ncbi:MAG: hypothetical protein MI974_31325 [Chitinophagales bacterium]|nr:hypothetical protein [Chitinophagales bacterium]